MAPSLDAVIALTSATLLLPLLATGSPLAGPPAPSPGPSPGDGDGGTPENVLILLADDVGIDFLASYGLGSNPANTPNLDALAASGVRFVNAWATPVCTPTRAAVMTGRYGFRTGQGYLPDPSYALPLAETTLPEMLDLGTGSAWDHGAFGKWHLGNVAVGGPAAPNLAGWDHFVGTTDNLEPAPDDYFSYTKYTNGVPSISNTYATTDVVDDALAWISTAQEPWLCYLAFHAAHTPVHAPPAALHTVDLSGAAPPSVDPVPYYRAMVEAMDTEIGRLLAGLGSAGPNTTVIFMSDNGSPAEVTLPPFDPGHAKGFVYDGGVNVPLIVGGPRVTTPGVSEALVHAVDLYAAVAGVAGVDPTTVVPPGTTIDAVDFLPHVADPALPSTRTRLFSEVFWPNGPQSAPPVDPPVGTVCQPDLGFAGPGNVTLSTCGELLAEFGSADLHVSGMSPGTTLWIVAAIAKAPVPLFGGTLVPNPPIGVYPFVADVNGELTLNMKGGTGPAQLTTQVVALDFTLSPPFAFSNAIEIDFLAPNSKAMRDGRYKLILSVLGGPEQFFDLETDPFEQNDLIQSGMNAAETTAYTTLKADLTALMTSP